MREWILLLILLYNHHWKYQVSFLAHENNLLSSRIKDHFCYGDMISHSFRNQKKYVSKWLRNDLVFHLVIM